MRPLLQIETRPAESVRVGKTRLIPFAQSVLIALPGIPGGLIWNRPVSILSVYPDGREEVTPVTDMTRRIQIVIFGIGLIGGLLMCISYLNRQTKEKTQ